MAARRARDLGSRPASIRRSTPSRGGREGRGFECQGTIEPESCTSELSRRCETPSGALEYGGFWQEVFLAFGGTQTVRTHHIRSRPHVQGDPAPLRLRHSAGELTDGTGLVLLRRLWDQLGLGRRLYNRGAVVEHRIEELAQLGIGKTAVDDLGGNRLLWAMGALAYQLLHVIRTSALTGSWRRAQPERLRSWI